jgi:hypothetical protein
MRTAVPDAGAERLSRLTRELIGRYRFHAAGRASAARNAWGLAPQEGPFSPCFRAARKSKLGVRR